MGVVSRSRDSSRKGGTYRGIQGIDPGFFFMQARKIFITILIAASSCATGFGRIGEHAPDLAKRYGAPVSSDAMGRYVRAVYQKGSFEITVYYVDGASVMETFAGRGFDQPSARALAVKVASNPTFAAADADHETALRAETGITTQGEMFWIWTTPGGSMTAAFNPVECTLSFFALPGLYADIHKTLASQPL